MTSSQVGVPANPTSGRPAGALNRSTKELQAYLLQQHGSPVVAAARAMAARGRAVPRDRP